MGQNQYTKNPKTLEQRIQEFHLKYKKMKVSKFVDDECWIIGDWQKDSYAYFRWNDGEHLSHHAHVFSCKFIKKIPYKQGMHVHHKCNIKKCCNPDHVDLVTPKENSHLAIKDGKWDPVEAGRLGGFSIPSAKTKAKQSAIMKAKHQTKKDRG